jgi:hypothetical protein
MAYDQACYNLAKTFLAETQHTEADRHLLAQQIQHTIEDFLTELEERQQRRHTGESPRTLARGDVQEERDWLRVEVYHLRAELAALREEMATMRPAAKLPLTTGCCESDINDD